MRARFLCIARRAVNEIIILGLVCSVMKKCLQLKSVVYSFNSRVLLVTITSIVIYEHRKRAT